MTLSTTDHPPSSTGNKPRRPKEPLLLRGTLLLLLSPLILIAAAAGVLHPPPLGYAVTAAALSVLALVWLWRRAALAGPLFLLAIAGFAWLLPSSPRVYVLDLGRSSPLRGIAVHCNDVFLGVTPLTISETDFKNKVPPWSSPPVQPRVEWPGSSDEPRRLTMAKFSYVPQDIFETQGVWPPDNFRYFRGTDEDQVRDLAETRYWWRFEMEGSTGLASAHNFGGGGGGGRIHRIHASPSIEFPSADRHLELVIMALETSGFEPDAGWLTHFDRHAGLLFMGFWNRAQQDTRLRAALDQVVRQRYDIPAAISPSDAARIFAAVLQQAETDRSFVVPSIHAEAVVLAGRAQPDVLANLFLRELRSERFAGGGASGAINNAVWTVRHANSSRDARLLPLLHAVADVRPEKLFGPLVYHSGNGQFLNLIGNYPGERAARIVIHHLHKVRTSRGARNRHEIFRLAEPLSRITHPEIEQASRQFLQQHGNDAALTGHVLAFVASRIRSPEFAQNDLAAWIYNFAPLDAEERARFLAELHTPSAAQYLRLLSTRNPRAIESLSQMLAEKPNPYLDRFLIDLFEESVGSRSSNRHTIQMGGAQLGMALLKSDTGPTRDFLERLWNERRPLFIAGFRGVQLGGIHEGSHEHLNWLAAAASEMEDPGEKREIVALLGVINTEPAREVLRGWAASADGNLALAAQRELDLFDARSEARRRDLELARALISGAMRPDDLLPPAVPHVWTGTGYIAQPGL